MSVCSGSKKDWRLTGDGRICPKCGADTRDMGISERLAHAATVVPVHAPLSEILRKAAQS